MNKYVAIDLGSSRISAMIAEVQNDGALKILAVESKASDDVKHGIVEQVSGAAFKINEVVKLAQNSAHIKEDVGVVSVSVNGRSLKTHPVTVNRFVDASKIVSEQLIQEMHHEAGEKVKGENVGVYDIIPLSYELDGVKMDEPVGQKGTQLSGKYTIVYGNKLIAERIERCFDRTGIAVDYTVTAIEALSTVVLEEEEREIGCALINLGANTTTLGIYHEGALRQLLVSPLGGKNITRDIMELGIAEDKAEKIKCLAGSALSEMVQNPVYIQIHSVIPDANPVKISTGFLATIIEARLDEITQPLFNAIKNYPHKLEGGIVITGGGAKMKNIIEYINQHSEMDARKGSHSDWLADSNADLFHDTTYSQLVGTIMLYDEYRKLHPLEVEKKGKKTKIQKKGFTDRITKGLLTFFSDDNDMN